MRTVLCPSLEEHGRHEWHERWILRRSCPGLVVAFCGRNGTHAHHWHGEYTDELCCGAGLAGRCRHGEQMLNECKACEFDHEMDRLVADIEREKRQ
jgi:hypothetical protein